MSRAALVAIASVALLAAGCGGAPAEHSAQPSGWLDFSRCMRAHGVSRYPDPDRGGTPPKESLPQLGVDSSRFEAAQSACGHLLPNGGRPPDQAARQRVRAQALQFSRCVRSHGVAHFPDPGSDGRIPDPARAGIDQGSPRFEAANRACATYRPPYIPTNAAYNAWARTHANGSGS